MSTRDTAPLLWLGLVLAIALAIAFLLPVTPNDYWWYLRLGEDTLAGGYVPRVDAFTWTRLGEPVVYHSWGAALLFLFLYNLGGLTLTVLVRGLLVAASYGLVWLVSRRLGAGRIGAALVLLLAVLASSNNWSLRPQLFAYPLFMLSVHLLYHWHAGRKKAVFWLPLICLLWVNLHGSFILLLLLVAAALAFGGGSRRTLLLAAGGVLLATFINPRLAGAWTYVFDSLTAPSSQSFSAEWMPPVNDHWQMNLFFLWLLIFPLLAAFSPRRLSLLEWAWFLGFGFLALWGERYVIWFVMLLAVLTASLLSDWERKLLGEPRPGSPPLNLALALAFPLLSLALLPGLRQGWWPRAPAATENTPIQTVEWLSARPGLPGPLWSAIAFSSYLEYALPERPTWIDTRFEVFPVEQWEAYEAISTARFDWQTRLDLTEANLLMVSIMDQPELVALLDVSPSWCVLHRDDVAVLYQRCGGGE